MARADSCGYAKQMNEESGTLTASGSTSDASVRSKPVLVVIDDDQGVLYALRRILEKRYQIHTYASALAGVSMVRWHRPAAVILDMRMPVYDGLWALKGIRNFDGRIPVILNSSYLIL